ncbi:MAG: hypothetical protein KC877_04510, partial [Candidatus Kaiserbacteria bacterium]|nr:hypothetical protein [Candidatus Kaiserbacteria bacterium]
VESGEYQIPEVPSIEAPVSENAPTEGFEDAVITNSDVETDLVTPVNTITNSEGAEGEPVVDETVDAAESAVEPLPETVETE